MKTVLIAAFALLAGVSSAQTVTVTTAYNNMTSATKVAMQAYKLPSTTAQKRTAATNLENSINAFGSVAGTTPTLVLSKLKMAILLDANDE
jgi:hypothetical protein